MCVCVRVRVRAHIVGEFIWGYNCCCVIVLGFKTGLNLPDFNIAVAEYCLYSMRWYIRVFTYY